MTLTRRAVAATLAGAACLRGVLERTARRADDRLHKGLADVKAGRTKPAREVFNRLRRTHGIPR